MLFAGVLAAMTVATVWVGNELGGLRSATQLARTEAESWQERFAGERRNVEDLERRLAEAEASGDAGTDELRARLPEGASVYVTLCMVVMEDAAGIRETEYKFAALTAVFDPEDAGVMGGSAGGGGGEGGGILT